jgi:hypothetical protein
VSRAKYNNPPPPPIKQAQHQKITITMTQLKKYEKDSFSFAEVFHARIEKGVVYLEEYGEGAFPLPHIKTEKQYLELYETLTGKKRKKIKEVKKNNKEPIAENNQIEYFRKAIKLYASLQISLELCTDIKNSPFVKNSLKAKISNLEKQLELDIRPYVNKLYDKDEEAFQVIQNSIEMIRDNSLEEIVDRAIEMSNLAETN